MIMDLAIEFRKMCWNLMDLLLQGEHAIIAADSSNVLCAFAVIVISITLSLMQAREFLYELAPNLAS